MDAVDHRITSLLKIKHSHGKTVPSGTLYRGLKDTTTNQLVSTPLPSVSTLAVDSHAHPITPNSFTQLELWPLPTDKSSAG